MQLPITIPAPKIPQKNGNTTVFPKPVLDDFVFLFVFVSNDVYT